MDPGLNRDPTLWDSSWEVESYRKQDQTPRSAHVALLEVRTMLQFAVLVAVPATRTSVPIPATSQEASVRSDEGTVDVRDGHNCEQEE